MTQRLQIAYRLDKPESAARRPILVASGDRIVLGFHPDSCTCRRTVDGIVFRFPDRAEILLMPSDIDTDFSSVGVWLPDGSEESLALLVEDEAAVVSFARSLGACQ